MKEKKRVRIKMDFFTLVGKNKTIQELTEDFLADNGNDDFYINSIKIIEEPLSDEEELYYILPDVD